MEFLDIAKAISELGILVVIAGLFLYVSYKNNKAQSDITNKLFEEMINQMKICAGGHVLTEEEDRTALKIDNAINILLQNAVGDLKCSRIMIVRYHNGGRDMNSVSFLKLSVTNECVNYGYKPVMSEFQNQFRSILGYPVNEIEKTGHSYVTNIEDIKNFDIGTYELLKSRGVRAYYAHSITNTTNYVIGNILVTYNTDNSVEEEQEFIHQYLTHLSDQISSLLNVKNEESK